MFSLLVAAHESHNAAQLVFFSENQHRAHMWDKLQLNPALRGRSGLFVDYTY